MSERPVSRDILLPFAYEQLAILAALLDRTGHKEFAALAHGVGDMRRAWLQRVRSGQASVAAGPIDEVLDYFLSQTSDLAVELRAVGLVDSALVFEVFEEVYKAWQARVAAREVAEVEVVSIKR